MLSFWLSLLPGTFGYNTLTKSLFSNFPIFLLLSKFVHVYSLLPRPLSLNSSQSTTHPQHIIQYLHLRSTIIFMLLCCCCLRIHPQHTIQYLHLRSTIIFTLLCCCCLRIHLFNLIVAFKQLIYLPSSNTNLSWFSKTLVLLTLDIGLHGQW